jgi:hypothetical protein
MSANDLLKELLEKKKHQQQQARSGGLNASDGKKGSVGQTAAVKPPRKNTGRGR